MRSGDVPFGPERVAVHAARAFTERFGREPSWFGLAPGRVNLIGEHTDYNGGYVLPMTIERYVVIAAAPAPPREGRRLRVHSTSVGGSIDIALDTKPTPAEPPWANYVRGVVAGLQERLGARSAEIPPIDALIVSNLPLGGGLSSSAALEVATATLLARVAGLELAPRDKARLCQRAEHDFARVPCGIMDQMVVSLGDDRGPLLIDCRSEEARTVRFGDPTVSVLIANTNVRHALGDGAYARRRAECETAARILGVETLRDTNASAIDAARGALGPVVHRRARHVVTENARTLEAARLLEIGDADAVGDLMYESHRSLRDDYEVSCPELDVLVDAAHDIGKSAGALGARMTGGGFGGCTVTLVRSDKLDVFTRELGHRFERKTGRSLDAFVSRPASGAATFDAADLGRALHAHP